MFRKRRPKSRPSKKDEYFSLGQAPISDDMYKRLDDLKNSTASGEDAEKELNETIKQLIIASLDQLSKQSKNGPANSDTDNTK